MSDRQKTFEVGKQLLANFREQKDLESIDRLYSPAAISVESQGSPEMPAAFEGADAIRGKHAWWSENFELHSSSAEGPFLHGDQQFGVIFDMDVTEQASGHRMQMRELAIYTVEDGKITREEFYYNTPGDG